MSQDFISSYCSLTSNKPLTLSNTEPVPSNFQSIILTHFSERIMNTEILFVIHLHSYDTFITNTLCSAVQDAIFTTSALNQIS